MVIFILGGARIWIVKNVLKTEHMKTIAKKLNISLGLVEYLNEKIYK